MRAPAAAIVCILALKASAVILPPTVSQSAVTYYRLPYLCPSQTRAGDLLDHLDAGPISPYGTVATFACTYGLYPFTTCQYSASTGALNALNSNCAASALTNTGCGYECATTDTSGRARLLQLTLSADGASLSCLYSGRTSACSYSGVALVTGPTECPVRVPLVCAGTQRRYFRGVDNYTAWLRRSAGAREPDAAAARASR